MKWCRRRSTVINVVGQRILRKSCWFEVHRSAFLMSRTFKRSGGMGRCNGFRQDTADGAIIRVGGASQFNRAVFLVGAIVDCREIAWERDGKATRMTYDNEARRHWQVPPAPDEYWVTMLPWENDCTYSSSLPRPSDKVFFQNHPPDLLSWSSYAIHMFRRNVVLKSALCNIEGVVEMSIECWTFSSAACDFFFHTLNNSPWPYFAEYNCKRKWCFSSRKCLANRHQRII